MKIRKILAVVLTFCMFGLSIMPVFAASYKLNIEKESAETKYLENDQGYISKKIINSNPEEGEVTVELEVSNQSQNKETQVTVKENNEIVIVLDESGSMSTKIDIENNLSRYDIVVASAKELTNNILSNSTNVKIGTVSFGTYAQVTQTLTDDKTSLDAVYTHGRYEDGLTFTTDALTLAERVFSNEDNEKVIIILTDGAPSDDTTKDKLIELEGKDYNIITMLTDSSSSATKVFGTTENPTVGKLYLIGDSEISTIIKDNIFSDVMEIVKKNESIKDVTITDYFPNDIKDNFEFSYVTKPSTGTISEKISDDNTIIYTVDELKGNESIKISYKLKLKDMNNKELLNKVISTNEKVVLKYKDSSTVEHEVILTSSPSIKLIEVQSVEETVENPPTGLYISLGILIVAIVGGVTFILSKKKNYFSKI